MSLMYCPECSQQVSDLAENCIHCGYPLAKMKNKSPEEAKLFGSYNSDYNCICTVGANKLDFTEIVERYRAGEDLNIPAETRKIVDRSSVYTKRADIQKLMSELMVSLYTYGEVPSSVNINATTDETIELSRQIVIKWVKNKSDAKGPIFVCPYCKSKKVARLGVLDRAISFELVGFASNKIGKSFKCRNCGYTW